MFKKYCISLQRQRRIEELNIPWKWYITYRFCSSFPWTGAGVVLDHVKEQLCQSRKVESWWQRQMAQMAQMLPVNPGILHLWKLQNDAQSVVVSWYGNQRYGVTYTVNICRIQFLFLKSWLPRVCHQWHLFCLSWHEFTHEKEILLGHECLMIELALLVCWHHQPLSVRLKV